MALPDFKKRGPSFVAGALLGVLLLVGLGVVLGLETSVKRPEDGSFAPAGIRRWPAQAEKAPVIRNERLNESLRTSHVPGFGSRKPGTPAKAGGDGGPDAPPAER